MNLKYFRELTKDYADDVVITFLDIQLTKDGSVKLLESDYVNTDISKYVAINGEVKVGKVIILE